MVAKVKHDQKLNKAEHEIGVAVDRYGADSRDHDQVGRDGITAVVEELPQGRAATGSPGLLAVDGVQ